MKEPLKVLTLLLIILCLSSYNKVHSQAIENLGISLNYNYGAQNTGIGLRYNHILKDRLSLVPQIRYQPSFNSIHELYVGIMMNYSLYENNIFSVYAIGGGEFNYWFNHITSINKRANKLNVLAKLGAGVELPLNKVVLFSEFTVNPIWKESISQLGIRLGNNRKVKNKQLKCPKFF